MLFEIGEKVRVNSIIKVEGLISNGLSKPEVQLYQVEVLEGEHKGKLLWFAEHELQKIN